MVFLMLYNTSYGISMYFIGFDSYPTGPKMRATMEVYWWWWLYQILSIPERFPERLKRVTPEWDINQWLEPFLTQVLGSDSRKPKTCLVEPRIADTSCNKRGSLSHFLGLGRGQNMENTSNKGKCTGRIFSEQPRLWTLWCKCHTRIRTV